MEFKMKISKSKIALACIVMESSLGKSDKLDLINFIEKISPNVSDKLINIQEIDDFLKTKMVLSTALSMGKLSYNKIMTDGMRACRDRPEDQKNDCLRSYKERALKARLDALRKQSTKCGQTMNMAKCRDQFRKSIRRVEDQIRSVR